MPRSPRPGPPGHLPARFVRSAGAPERSGSQVADHAPPPATSGKRTRLTAENRRAQILDAALHEFSAVGFAGATMDKIGRRIGLTKAGLYAHFDSKEQLLDTLMAEVLCTEAAPASWQWRAGATLEHLVDAYLDRVYELIRLPRVRATFRLLVTETARDPQRMQRWNALIFAPHTQRRQAEMDECVARGVVADNAFSRHVSLTSSPAVIAMLGCDLLDDAQLDAEWTRIRAAHRCMLLCTLATSSEPDTGARAMSGKAPPAGARA